ncbi:MAG: peptidylprolyl isomerase [Clostridia bacterium]|nr:peptidylprolyl isomerase [Clostridia bacterium]MBQ3554276.1 peptidylprolyl isomerase [Clostridia bacterium]
MRKIVCLVLSLMLVVLSFVACTGKDNKFEGVKYVELTMESGDTMIIELFPDKAPLTVNHFLENVSEGYYDGKVFHRAVKGFMIQGGSADGNGVGGSARTVKGEFAANGVENNLKHTRGIVSMARTNEYDSGSGQFFIMHAKTPSLDGQYAAFGRVVEGIELVDKIVEMPVNGEILIEKPVIRSIHILENYTRES